jgi:hypothetical protein
MVKMHRKVGAVAIYSPTAVALIVLVAVVVLAGAGYAACRLAADDERRERVVVARSSSSTSPRPEERRLRTELTAANARIERVLDRLGEERARIRRLRARARRGGATADRGAASLRLGRPYVVTLREGRGGADYTIGRRAPLQPGETYRICSDGQGICLGGGR